MIKVRFLNENSFSFKDAEYIPCIILVDCFFKYYCNAIQSYCSTKF